MSKRRIVSNYLVILIFLTELMMCLFSPVLHAESIITKVANEGIIQEKQEEVNIANKRLNEAIHRKKDADAAVKKTRIELKNVTDKLNTIIKDKKTAEKNVKIAIDKAKKTEAELVLEKAKREEAEIRAKEAEARVKEAEARAKKAEADKEEAEARTKELTAKLELEKLKGKPPVTMPPPPVLEPEMISIKSDCFQMGSPENEPERDYDEKQHEVCVSDFKIGKYEVTQTQWQSVMGYNPSYFKGDNLPVENVSWNDVQQFIAKLNQQSRKKYRLPTEAEWEYVCRAGTTTPYYTGDTINYAQANFDETKEKTTKVGSYPPNSWGLYDMYGNVWEWTCSSYSENYDGNEKKCSNDLNTQHVMRGGSWVEVSASLRSANRGQNSSDFDSKKLGFRIVESKE